VHGFFRANGGCGYVKKPDFLLPNGSENDDQHIFDPKAPRPVKTTLKVKFILIKRAGFSSMLQFSCINSEITKSFEFPVLPLKLN
jgi:phosphatidylinositol phospholipase C delta